LDYSPYAFQWYDASSVPISGATLYNLSNLDQGTYYVRVTNTQKGCQSAFVPGTITRPILLSQIFTITKISDQTLCSPANGELVVSPDDASTGYTYKWLDLALNPIGVTGADAKNLLAGNYVVQITRGTCITRHHLRVLLPAEIPGCNCNHCSECGRLPNPNSAQLPQTQLLMVLCKTRLVIRSNGISTIIGPPASTGSILPAGKRNRPNSARVWQQDTIRW